MIVNFPVAPKQFVLLQLLILNEGITPVMFSVYKNLGSSIIFHAALY